MTKAEQYKAAYEQLRTAYEEMIEDVQDPEATRAQIALRHVDKAKNVIDQADDLLKVEVPDIVIVTVEGVIQDVHAQFPGVTYVVVDPDEEPDLDAVQRAGETFSKKDYENFIEETLDSYIPSESSPLIP
jgi:hypothetical protein